MPSDPSHRLQQPPSLAAKVHWLQQPATYPHAPQRIEAIETHMSWVFLADEYVYKLKKPVRRDFLDFSTLEARHRNCEEELRLNRRLAPDVYLNVVPLAIDDAATVRLGGRGEVLEWLVRMRRLPAECMLDYAIQHGTARDDEIRRLALRLAEFYADSAPIRMGPDEYRQRFEADIRATRQELLLPRYGLPSDPTECIAAAQLRFLARNPSLFDQRVYDERIIEAHGDLRPEHICLRPEPVIIDCLEFNRELRLLDSADELAFLALECERLGAPAIGSAILEICCDALNDAPPQDLVLFYKSYRAFLRAKLSIWHLRDDDVAQPSKWFNRALAYLRMAQQYILETRAPNEP